MMCHYFLSHDVSLILIYMYLVVERERMETAFPHKKLSGIGVPIREILRDIFLLLLLNLLFPTSCYHVTAFRASQK